MKPSRHPTRKAGLARLAGVAGLVLAALLAPEVAGAVDTVGSTDAPDLTAIRASIKAKEWAVAKTALDEMAQSVQHADVYNLLGFVNRNIGLHKTALTFYRKALDFDPNHKGALEYLGELYVKVGDMKSAAQNEALLIKLCPQGCEELDDLRKTIAKGPGTASMTDGPVAMTN